MFTIHYVTRHIYPSLKSLAYEVNTGSVLGVSNAVLFGPV